MVWSDFADRAKRESQDEEDDIVWELMAILEVISMEVRWSAMIGKACRRLENGEALSPRDEFLKLLEYAKHAYGDLLPDDDGFVVGSVAGDRLRDNPASGPLLLFFLRSLTRFAAAMNANREADAAEVRAMLAEAFRVTQVDSSGSAKRGAPPKPAMARAKEAFEDSLYQSAMIGKTVATCNEDAFRAAFSAYYKDKKYNPRDKDHVRLRGHIEDFVRKADLAFDAGEDISELHKIGRRL